MLAYEISEWSDFFVAVAGATAALAGLLFVAVSINVERILGGAGLPARALETLSLLMLALTASLGGLVPGQSATALGLELLILAGLAGALILRLPIAREELESVPRGWLMARWSVRTLGVAPFAIGAVSLLAESGGGLYWVAAGVLFAIVGAVTNAWVLLVEILR